MASSEQYAGRHPVFEFPAAAQVPTRLPDAAVRVLSVVRQLAGRYEEMVVKDPELTSKIESALRVASYLIPGAHLYFTALVITSHANVYSYLSESRMCNYCPLRLSVLGRLGGGWEVSELSKSVSAQPLYISYLMFDECYFFPVFGLVYRARPSSLTHQHWGRGVV